MIKLEAALAFVMNVGVTLQPVVFSINDTIKIHSLNLKPIGSGGVI